MEDDTDLEFNVITMTTGKICHQFSDSKYVYRQKTVKNSGAAYFVCVETSCPSVRMAAKYDDRESSNGHEAPVITT